MLFNPMSRSALAVKQNGFTLVEMLTVMVVLVAVASITLEATEEIAFEGRYEITKDRYEKIRKAIVGDPNQIINGQPNIEGFVKDVGRLPFALQELLIEGFCSDTQYFSGTDCTANGATWTDGYGWKGPYISSPQSADNNSALSDGWGNTSAGNYGWNVNYYSDSACTATTTTITGARCMTIQSLGKDQTLGVSTDPTYDIDYPSVQPAIRQEDWMIDINGITPIVKGGTSATDICLRIVRNSFQSATPIPPAKNVPGDSSQHSISFTVTNSNAPMGKALGIIYTDTNCTTTATAISVIANTSNPYAPTLDNNPICINTDDHANFTKGNCDANHGLWIEDGTEQYCDLVSGANCTGTTAPQLGGKEFKRFQIMLTPHTTLPTIYW